MNLENKCARYEKRIKNLLIRNNLISSHYEDHKGKKYGLKIEIHILTSGDHIVHAQSRNVNEFGEHTYADLTSNSKEYYSALYVLYDSLYDKYEECDILYDKCKDNHG
jgi:hypothetical protein